MQYDQIEILRSSYGRQNLYDWLNKLAEAVNRINRLEVVQPLILDQSPVGPVIRTIEKQINIGSLTGGPPTEFCMPTLDYVGPPAYEPDCNALVIDANYQLWYFNGRIDPTAQTQGSPGWVLINNPGAHDQWVYPYNPTPLPGTHIYAAKIVHFDLVQNMWDFEGPAYLRDILERAPLTRPYRSVLTEYEIEGIPIYLTDICPCTEPPAEPTGTNPTHGGGTSGGPITNSCCPDRTFPTTLFAMYIFGMGDSSGCTCLNGADPIVLTWDDVSKWVGTAPFGSCGRDISLALYCDPILGWQADISWSDNCRFAFTATLNVLSCSPLILSTSPIGGLSACGCGLDFPNMVIQFSD